MKFRHNIVGVWESRAYRVLRVEKDGSSQRTKRLPMRLQISMVSQGTFRAKNTWRKPSDAGGGVEYVVGTIGYRGARGKSRMVLDMTEVGTPPTGGTRARMVAVLDPSGVMFLTYVGESSDAGQSFTTRLRRKNH